MTIRKFAIETVDNPTGKLTKARSAGLLVNTFAAWAAGRAVWRVLPLVAVAVLAAAPVAGQESERVWFTETPEEAFCYGSVLDSHGEPVAGAQLLLLPMDSAEGHFLLDPFNAPPTTKATQAARDGQFEFELTIDDDEFWTEGDYFFVAAAPGYRSRFLRLPANRLLVDAPLEIQLQAAPSGRLRVLGSDGRPVSGATVSVSRVDGERVPAGVPDLPTFQTDRQGETEMTGFDWANLQEVIVQSPEIGIQRVPVSQEEGGGLVVPLRATGRLVGEIQIPGLDDLSAYAGESVWLVSMDSTQYFPGGAPVMSWCHTKLDAQGRFVADHLSYGHVYLRCVASESFPFVPDPTSDHESSEFRPDDQSGSLTFKFLPARQVPFLCLGDDGSPISYIEVYRPGLAGKCRADAAGGFSLWMAQGVAADGQMFLHDRFDRYTLEPFGVLLDRMGVNNQEIPDPIVLARSQSISGRVVYEDGSPVVDAAVTGTYSRSSSARSTVTTTDRHGRFQLRGLPAGAAISLIAQQGDKASEQQTPLLLAAGSPDHLEVVVKRQPVAPLVGRILNRNGDPLGGAKVKIEKAVVRQVEEYLSEQLRRERLRGSSDIVFTDQHGRFTSEPLLDFQDRFFLTIDAPGYRVWQSPALNGSAKERGEDGVQLGDFRLFAVPQRQPCRLSMRDANGAPVRGAEVVLIGPRSKRVSGTSDDSGVVQLELEDSPQLLAVNAAGFRLHLEFLEQVQDSLEIKLQTQDAAAALEPVDSFTIDQQALRSVARQLLTPLPQPSHSSSSFYRQRLYLSALATVDMERFQEILFAAESPYEHRRSFVSFNTDKIFWQTPQQVLGLLELGLLSKEQQTSTLWLFSLELPPEELELRDEVLGEALVRIGRLSGRDKRIDVGFVAAPLALQGHLDAAVALVSEVWEQSPELRQRVADRVAESDVATARIFSPKLAWIDPEVAFRSISLQIGPVEGEQLKAVALVYLSMIDRELALQLAQEQDLQWAAGIDRLYSYGGSWIYRDPSLAEWIGWLADQCEPSIAKARLLITTARHLPAGPERVAMFRRAAEVWREAKVEFWHYWRAPERVILEALAGYHDLRAGELDALLFASLSQGPDTYELYNSRSVMSLTVRMLAIRDPELSLKLLAAAMEDTDWLSNKTEFFALSDNQLVRSVAWLPPDSMVDFVQQLEARFSADSDLAHLEIRSAVIEEIETLIKTRGRRPEIAFQQ